MQVKEEDRNRSKDMRARRLGEGRKPSGRCGANGAWLACSGLSLLVLSGFACGSMADGQIELSASSQAHDQPTQIHLQQEQSKQQQPQQQNRASSPQKQSSFDASKYRSVAEAIRAHPNLEKVSGTNADLPLRIGLNESRGARVGVLVRVVV